MIATAAMHCSLLGEWTLSSLIGALSSRFGGEAAGLEEAAVLRLVGEARAGDRAAGQRLYREHVDRVYRTVRGMLRSDLDAEDVTQDAMLTVLTSLKSYVPRTETRFAAWVATIAVNTARRRFRRRRPELADPSDLSRVRDDTVDLELAADGGRKRRALVKALAELDSREQEIVSLRYGSELTATEIASVLGLESANVRKILERTRVRLGARIEELLSPMEELR